jgi:hypothetical protein
VPLVELWRSREIAEREKKASQNTNGNDPNPFNDGMPETAKIEPAPSLDVLPREMRQRRLIGIGRNGRSCSMVRRINHRKYWLKQDLTRKRCGRKGAGAKTFRLKNTFPNSDGVAWHDAKTSAAFLGEALSIDLENLIATRVMSSHGYPFWRGDARVSAGHRDRL